MVEENALLFDALRGVLNLMELEFSPVVISINPMGGPFHERWSNTASFFG